MRNSFHSTSFYCTVTKSDTVYNLSYLEGSVPTELDIHTILVTTRVYIRREKARKTLVATAD